VECSTGRLIRKFEKFEGAQPAYELCTRANLRTGEVLWQGASSKTAKLDQRSVPGIVTEMSREVANIVEGLVSSMQDRVSAASLSLSHSNTEQ
jgi:hypothetical protein